MALDFFWACVQSQQLDCSYSFYYIYIFSLFIYYSFYIVFIKNYVFYSNYLYVFSKVFLNLLLVIYMGYILVQITNLTTDHSKLYFQSKSLR